MQTAMMHLPSCQCCLIYGRPLALKAHLNEQMQNVHAPELDLLHQPKAIVTSAKRNNASAELLLLAYMCVFTLIDYR